MNEAEDILVRVERFLRDDLAKESLSIEAEESRRLLLDELNKHLHSDENADFLRKKRQTSKKSKRWSCDVKYFNPENVSEDGGNKRQSKSSEKKEANLYEKNFSFIGGEQSDSCEGSGYESFEDQRSLNSAQSDKRPDQKRSSKRSSKVKTDSELLSTAERNYEGHLYKKGKLNSWRKLYCVIFGRWLVCHTKDSKQLYRINMQGYEATQQRTKDGGGKYEHELRLTGPGLKTYIFYAKDKVEAELWVIELTKAIQRTRDCSSVLRTPSTEANYTPTNPLQECENSYDIVDGNIIRHEQGSIVNSSTKSSIFHNLIHKVKQRAMAAFDSSTDSFVDKQHVSGVLQVTFDDFSKPNWMQRYCMIKSKQLEVYKSHGSERPELVIPLPGMCLTLIPNTDFFVLCLNQPSQKMYVKFSNHPELNKWYQNLQRASQVLPELPVGCTDASLYDEIGESQGSGIQRPPVPECPPPMTPDVIGALMDMDEMGYMDVLECRQPILTNSNESRAYEEVNLYINRDKNSPADSKNSKNSKRLAASTTTTSAAATTAAASCGTDSNASKSFHYCPMWKGKSSEASTSLTTKGMTKTAASSAAKTTSVAATSSAQSCFKSTSAATKSTFSTAPTTANSPGLSIRSKVTGSSAVKSSPSSTCSSAKKLSDFNETREKFLLSSSSSLSSKNKPLVNPAPSKWTTNLSKNTASLSVSNNLDDADDGLAGGCALRKHDRSLSTSRNSNPNPEADKRSSEYSSRSNIVQEKMKIFQKN